jgi:hypothetical protein
MNYLDLDFLEIGTSDFDTLIETADNNTNGICVEPLSYYLNKLPNKSHVKKINCAISFEDIEDTIEIFYIPEEIIKSENLPYWLKGCNSVGDYHTHHRRLNLTHLVKTEIVNQIPISKLLLDHNVRQINHLKIDTEGGDCFILKNLFFYLKDKSKEFFPSRITFESNNLTSSNLIHETIELYTNHGYVISPESDADNTVLILKNDNN